MNVRGHEIAVRIGLDLAVEIQNMQDVEQLALVLMQALDLDIENGIRVDAHAVLVLR